MMVEVWGRALHDSCVELVAEERRSRLNKSLHYLAEHSDQIFEY
jgi:hypothetical protein